MNREQAKKLWPIIKEWAEDETKELQFRDINKEWADFNEYISSIEYRIKPKEQYRPYKDLEEFEKYNEGKECIWLKGKYHNGKYMVTEIGEEFIVCNRSVFSYEKAFDLFTYLNGQPFGVKE